MFDTWAGPVWGSAGSGPHEGVCVVSTALVSPALDRPATARRPRLPHADGGTGFGRRSAGAATALRLLMAAQRARDEADSIVEALPRYATAHLAALRAAAAVLAARPDPGRPRRPTSAWTLLVGVAPEMQPWAAYFAAGAHKRAAAEAGLPDAVSRREADDLVRDVTAFIGAVEAKLGMLSLASARDGITGPDLAARHRR
jgi:hypothetical protein